MDFTYDQTTCELSERITDFMDSHIYPAESRLLDEVEKPAHPWGRPPLMEELKQAARERRLWNLFLPNSPFGAGLSNLQYAPLAEISGRSPWLAPEAMNCSAPDTGNMEILAQFGTPDQQERWLRPLLDGRIRSAFCMTEPGVASSDARNIRTTIKRDGSDYVINGRKWWSTGALAPECELLVVMGKSDPEAKTYRQQSIILVPKDAVGVTVVRSTHTFGYTDETHGGHAEIEFRDVRVPASNLVMEEGAGFRLAQERLGPGRIHHCMRMIGVAERALELMCRRALEREAFGEIIADKGVVQDWIARARLKINQTRLLVLHTAWLMDTVGNKEARAEIAAIKIAAAELATSVVDRAIQTHGAAGISQDTPLAEMYAYARTLHFADGPSEVHVRTIALDELKRYRDTRRVGVA